MDGNEVDLSLMELKEAPVKELASIPKATRVDLSYNLFTTLPPSFCNLSHLVKLNLSKNKLKELPDEFGQLKNLQELDLYSNQLNILPESFHQLKNLKWLDLKENPLENQLKTIAGDYLTEKDYYTSAKKVVAFMQAIHDSLEIERGKRKLKSEAKAAQRKRKEEAKKEQLRLEKKAEKEKRRDEMLKSQKLLEEREARAAAAASKKQNSGAKSQKTKKKNTTEKKKMQPKRKSTALWFWIPALFVLVIAAFLWKYMGTDFSEEQFLKARAAFATDAQKLYNSSLTIGRDISLLVAERVGNTIQQLQIMLQTK